MNILGSLYIQLKAETASFVQGMSAASYSAKKASRDIEESFTNLGSLASSALAPFGEFGAIIGESLSHIGEWGAKAGEGIAHLGGGMSFLAVGAGAGAAALLAVDAAAIGLAISATEGAAKLLLMSQASGVSVETLSALSFAAKMTGVDQETLVKSLEKFDKAMLKSATSVPGTANAFTRLHVAVRDSDGQLRSTEEVFGDVAERFSQMQDGAAKTGLAIELFGRGGAVMIPLLNEGKAGIEEFINTAKALGLVLDTETAEGAHKFRQDLETIEAAGQGISIRFMKELLPSIESLTHAFVEGLKDPDSGITKLVDGMSYLAKISIAVAQTVWTGFQTIGLAIKTAAADVLIFSDQLADIWHAVSTGNFGDVGKIFKNAGEAQKANSAQFLAETKKIWHENSDFIENTFGPAAPHTLSHKDRSSFNPDTKPEKADRAAASMERQIAALKAAAEAELGLALAGTQSEAVLAMQNARAEASVFISKLVAEAWSKEGAEREKLLGIVMASTEAIEAESAVKKVASDIEKAGSTIRKDSDKYSSEIDSIRRLAAAYQEGGAAVAAAQIDDQLRTQEQLLAKVQEEYNLLANDGLPHSKEEMDKAAAAIAAVSEQLDYNRALLAQLQSAKIDEDIAKRAFAYGLELPALKQLNDAYFQNAAAVRAAEVERKVAAFSAANPGASAAQIEKIREQETEAARSAHENAIAQEAASYDLVGSYQRELEKLSEIREAVVQNGRSALLVDAAIYDANNKAIQQWDQAALKVGTLTEKFRAMMNEVALQGQNFSGKIFEAFGKAIDDVSTQLAKLVVTGKANFKELFQGLEESIVKAGFQKVIGSVAGAINQKFFGGAIPGLGPKADGSQGSPFFVKVVSSSGSILDSLGGGGDGGGLWGGSATQDNGGIWDESIPGLGGQDAGGGLLGGFFSKIGSVFSSIFSSITGVLSKIVGGIGGGISSIFRFFGGFLANGGDVSPGRAYIVGERHPEFFVPRQAGQVTPSLQMGATHQTQVSIHIHGVKDADSFKKSQGQIMSHFQHQLAVAYQRNR